MPGRHSKSSFCDDCCPKVCLSTVFLEVLRGHEIMLITWLLIQCLGKKKYSVGKLVQRKLQHAK